MPELRRFVQVDVFTATPLKGNALAVVVDGAGLADAEMAEFARWTNLSETTFLLPPTDPAADYRVRIFTPGGELPFAGHPTLGSAHAFLASGGDAKKPGEVVQQCAVGLVRVKRDGARLAFAAPPLKRSGPVDAATRAQAIAALRIAPEALLDAQWVDNGPGWMAVRLADAAGVLALRPDFIAMQGLKLGVVGAHPAGSECQFEVRAFVPDLGIPEDPVTGSLNAGLALWLQQAGLAGDSYVAAQGAALGRAGRVHVRRDADATWIGGDVVPLIHGQVRL
ncbi:PhzF family phenazine biosynthesis protein [Pelomonas aquatica]|jgi:PhzF family phenazine biosynthesis protein|uniref:PhzF family phenazine biosynthesis protein n=1 Tax=Pelomonas aquatica TaxID=431058 RepID=A0A9X4R694_9BURK|nr:PhzF family phenazine biosynthesis protein [Pelomonas aquatica]MCY4756113.1 PhzF family phenazine biosynthesis protein [Pelomonas aquatica]MDG0864074.1 PhzF family phenazine biosynthesis protein [Pelomonas aquatica]